MLFQFDVSGPTYANVPEPVPQSVPANTNEILRQILEVQKEQLALTRALALANDGGHRWRTFLNRWNEHYPDLASTCKAALPQIERAYMELMNELAEKLREDPDAIDNEFTLGEFLDRYGMKLGQLGQILNLVTPIAEAAPPPAPPAAATEDSADDGAA